MKHIKHKNEKTLELLKQSEKKFGALFNNISSGVVIYEVKKGGNQFIIKDINKAGETISQVKRKNVIGKDLVDVFPGIIEYSLYEAFQRVWKTGNSEFFPPKLYENGRISYWAKNYIYKLPSGDIVVIYEDVSEEKKTEENLKKSEKEFRELSEELEQRIQERTIDLNESKQLLEKTLYSLHDAVFILDAETVEILECNPAASEIFGYSKEEMVGHTTTFLHVDENYLEEFRRNLNPAIEKEGFLKNFEFAMKRKDGTIFFTEHNVTPIYDEKDNQIGWVSVVSDISERKKSEQQLKESKQNYLKAYNTSSMYKDIFAHDINNILQNIQTSIELSELYFKNPEKIKDINKLYQVIKEQINRGSKLVSNVRKLSQIEELEIPLKSMDLCSILNDSLQSIRSGFQDRDLNIHVDSFSKKILVQANDLLIDVFENIITNGIRHNNNPKVEISIKILKEQISEAEYIKMEFKDNGVGITEEQKKNIFQKTISKSKSGKGMGLGLSLVKNIIDSYKGFILVEDRIQGDHTKGSNFILLIPEAD